MDADAKAETRKAICVASTIIFAPSVVSPGGGCCSQPHPFTFRWSMPTKKGPKSPHSTKALEEVTGRELDAWVAAELDGYNGVSKRPDGNYQGNKGGVKFVPDYRNPAAVKALAANLTGGRRLVLRTPTGAVNVDNATPDLCELANRALVLESMFKRGAVTQ